MNSFQHYPQQQHLNYQNASPIPLKRTRAKRSCDFCRKRKSRCDADSSTPCSNCKAVRETLQDISRFILLINNIHHSGDILANFKQFERNAGLPACKC
jgi:hypothetical protein